MTDPFLAEYRTDRSYAIRLKSCRDWNRELGVELTSLPARWHTNDPDDLRRLAAMAAEAADWLEEATA